MFGTCAGMILLDRVASRPRSTSTSSGTRTAGRSRASRPTSSSRATRSRCAASSSARRAWRGGPGVEVLAEHDGEPVLLREGRFLVASFHPELTDDTRVHELFLDSPSERHGRRHMSGHSKWSSIKHKKGAADAKRGQLFSKLARAIIVAAKEGGPDPAANLSLQNAIEKARELLDAEGQHRARDRAGLGRRTPTPRRTRRSSTRATARAAWPCSSRR